MKRLILILGGSRSGKSSYAIELAKYFKKRTAFIATCAFLDKEMTARIKKHRRSRPKQWRLIEEPRDIQRVLIDIQKKYDVVIVDCVGFWISNFLVDNLEDKEIEKKINGLLISISKINVAAILVSNEVGGGIVPDNLLARRFRDLVGLANQMIAKKADDVILMQAGIPLIIKEGKTDAKIK